MFKIRKIFKILILLLINISVQQLLGLADLIELNSGVSIDANILEENDEFISVDYLGVNLKFYRREIKNVTKKPIEQKMPVVAQKKQDASPDAAQEKSKSQLSKDEKEIFQKIFKNLSSESSKENVSEKTANPDIQNVKDNKEEISILKSLNLINQSQNNFLNVNLEVLNDFLRIGENKKAMDVILKVIDFTQESKAKVTALDSLIATDLLKNQALDYYERFILYQSTLLKSLVNPKSVEIKNQLDQLASEINRLEESFSNNLGKQMDKFQMSSLQDLSPNPNIQLNNSTNEQLQDAIAQYKILVDQTKELIQVNQKLKAETQQLIETNANLYQDLKGYLEQNLPNMNAQQRKEFLKYLNKL